MLTRAALVFASVTAIASCGKTNDPQPQPPNTIQPPAPAYGPPPIDLSQTDAAPPQPQAVPAYGAPPVQGGKK
jgi:hypothetical protein